MKFTVAIFALFGASHAFGAGNFSSADASGEPLPSVSTVLSVTAELYVKLENIVPLLEKNEATFSHTLMPARRALNSVATMYNLVNSDAPCWKWKPVITLINKKLAEAQKGYSVQSGNWRNAKVQAAVADLQAEHAIFKSIVNKYLASNRCERDIRDR